MLEYKFEKEKKPAKNHFPSCYILVPCILVLAGWEGFAHSGAVEIEERLDGFLVHVVFVLCELQWGERLVEVLICLCSCLTRRRGQTQQPLTKEIPTQKRHIRNCINPGGTPPQTDAWIVS